MKKIAVMLVLAFMFASCSAAVAVRPAEAMFGGDWETGASIGSVIWGNIKGCYKVWNAPKGRKWEAFNDSYKEATEGVEGSISRGIGGTIAKLRKEKILC